MNLVGVGRATASMESTNGWADPCFYFLCVVNKVNWVTQICWLEKVDHLDAECGSNRPRWQSWMEDRLSCVSERSSNDGLLKMTSTFNAYDWLWISSLMSLNLLSVHFSSDTSVDYKSYKCISSKPSWCARKC